MTQVSVFGCGYLGTVHAACMASLGHEVVGIDPNVERVASLRGGRAPFYEPGLQELLTDGAANGRLRFSVDPEEASGAAVHFIGVGTPQSPGTGAADLSQLDAAISALLPMLGDHSLVVGKSTVPVGTAAVVEERVRARGARMVWNPEFLREGLAVRDTLRPDRLVYGLNDPDAEAMLDEVYSEILSAGTPKIVTDFATAELIKVASNAFLATKISYINAVAEVADLTGADVAVIADAMGLDARIGRRFLNAGIGFGGGCLPKDVRAFRESSASLGAPGPVELLSAVENINLRARDRMVRLIETELGGTVDGRRVAILGLAFKVGSDDVRDSPSLAIAGSLASAGAAVSGYDPEAGPAAARVSPTLHVASSWEQAVAGADLIAVLTEWDEFRALDPQRVSATASARVIVDGRGALDAERWIQAGWRYRALGRPAVEVNGGRD